MITNRNEAKTKVRDISCDLKCKSNSTTCNSDQKWNDDIPRKYKIDYSWNPSTRICENVKYLKTIGNDLKILHQHI